MKIIFMIMLLSVNQAFAINLTSVAKTVTTAGTELPLTATSTKVTSVSVQAKCGNTGNIFIGDSGVSSTEGHLLDACQVWTYGNDNSLSIGNSLLDLNTVYIDTDSSGDGVQIIYTK